MDVSQPISQSQDQPVLGQPDLDPRLKPTPDYGTLGPGSDAASASQEADPAIWRPAPKQFRAGPMVAVTIGVLLAVLVGSVGSARAAWSHLETLFAPRTDSPSAGTLVPLDRMKPQTQVESLLESAVSNSDGAVDEIFARADQWRGKIQWSAQISTLATAALNSNDMRVREAGIEAELAAYGLPKNSSSVNSLVTDAGSSDHAQKIWALWALGLMANRGVETERATQALTSHLKDSDEESRRWAVEGLALVGTTPTIVPLLQTMHDDPSASVRERAACSLAESGMLTHEQRMTAVQQLINYTEDPALDGQTHAWAFQALGDITRQHLGNDSGAWRNWYVSSVAEGSR